MRGFWFLVCSREEQGGDVVGVIVPGKFFGCGTERAQNVDGMLHAIRPDEVPYHPSKNQYFSKIDQRIPHNLLPQSNLEIELGQP